MTTRNMKSFGSFLLEFFPKSDGNLFNCVYYAHGILDLLLCELQLGYHSTIVLVWNDSHLNLSTIEVTKLIHM